METRCASAGFLFPWKKTRVFAAVRCQAFFVAKRQRDVAGPVTNFTVFSNSSGSLSTAMQVCGADS
jgi:hypothetical protein